MNGKILNQAGAAIEDVAASIVKSDWHQAIAPKNMNAELAAYVAQSSKHTSGIVQDTVRNTLKSKIEITDDIEAAIKKISSDNLEESISNVFSNTEGVPEAVQNIVKKRAADSISDLNGNKIVQKMTKTERYMTMPKAYFSNPDKKVRDTRIATAVGAYATVAVGGRLLSGGTLTQDNYGRKDIAGVPFI